MSDTLQLLGTILDDKAGRDAVHVAVAPVIAVEHLAPGQHVGFVRDGDTLIVGSSALQLLGIIDPFLKSPVRPGQRCWLFLYPQTITSLRHEWTHPAFVGAPAQSSAEEASKAWIRSFAMELDQTYNRLMIAAELWVETDDGKYGGEYTYDNSETYKNVDHTKWPEFWRHYEIVTGKKPKNRESFFTCSC